MGKIIAILLVTGIAYAIVWTLSDWAAREEEE